MDHRLPGSSVHGILQARILEWVAVPSSGGSSWPRNPVCISCVSHWQVSSLPLALPFDPHWWLYIHFCVKQTDDSDSFGEERKEGRCQLWYELCSDIDIGTVAWDFLESLCHVLAGGSSHEQEKLTLANLAELEVLKIMEGFLSLFYGWVLFFLKEISPGISLEGMMLKLKL